MTHLTRMTHFPKPRITRPRAHANVCFQKPVRSVRSVGPYATFEGPLPC